MENIKNEKEEKQTKKEPSFGRGLLFIAGVGLGGYLMGRCTGLTDGYNMGRKRGFDEGIRHTINNLADVVKTASTVAMESKGE
jgi:hypothetical protein